MRKLFNYSILFIFIIMMVCGCEKSDLISYMDAKEKIINNHAVLLDVRTSDEYNAKHIDGAVNLSVDDINQENVSLLIDTTERDIIVYCQSGARSSEAVSKLKNLGYKRVYDLGSIDNWKE